MKLTKPSLLLFILLYITSSALAQQDAQFTQNMFYPMTFNPGFAGHENAICVVGADRMQWTGLNDPSGDKVTPETYFITINSPVRILKGGLSAMIMQDKIGYEKTIAVKLGYAYQKNIGFGKLGIGAQVEFNNRSIDYSKFNPAEKNDPLLQLSKESDMLIDFSLGLYYRIPGSFHVGLSGTHLIQTKGKTLVDGYKMDLDRTIYLDAGYELIFPNNPDFEFDPSILLQSNLSSMQINFAALLKYKETFWGGLAYRLQDAVAVIIGVQYKDFKIGYSYDVNISKLKLPIGGGTHEIMLNYCFKLNLEKGRKSYKNTRFL